MCMIKEIVQFVNKPIVDIQPENFQGHSGQSKIRFSTFLALNFFYEPADWAHPVFCFKYIALELNCQYLFQIFSHFFDFPLSFFKGSLDYDSSKEEIV